MAQLSPTPYKRSPNSPESECDDPDFETDVLPPLDSEDDGDGPQEVMIELLEIAAEEHVGLDDADATDLDVGVDLAGNEDEGIDEPIGDLIFDMTELLSGVEESSRDASSDEPLLWHDDSLASVETSLPSLGADAEEGLEDTSLDVLVEDDLPALDADADGDFEESPWQELAISDDGAPPLVAVPWSVEPKSHDEHTSLVALGTGLAAAGSTLSFWPTPDSPRLVTLPERATAMVSLLDSVLVATLRGRLYRARPDGRLAKLEAFERALPRGISTTPTALSIGASEERVVFVLDTGEVLESLDGCLTFHAVTTLRGALAVSSDARHIISRDGMHHARGGFELRVAKLPPALLEADAVRLASEGDVIALGSDETGVWLSTDGGAHFDAVGQTARVGALLVEDGEVFAGLGASISEPARVVMIDPARRAAVTVAELPLGEPERGAISGIVLAQLSDRLWVAGGMGVLALTRGPRPQ